MDESIAVPFGLAAIFTRPASESALIFCAIPVVAAPSLEHPLGWK